MHDHKVSKVRGHEVGDMTSNHIKVICEVHVV